MHEFTNGALVRLIAHLKSDGGKWPLEVEKPILTAINTWVAFRESDRTTLIRAAGWDQAKGASYRVDPLAERICDTWAAYLFGDEPRFSSPVASESEDGEKHRPDQENLDRLLSIDPTGSALDTASELERAAGIASSEGEVWGRIFVDRDLADRPILEWLSRLSIVPLWIGTRLIAVAVVTELKDPDTTKGKTVWRHFELHAPGIMGNVLFEGTEDKLGERRELDQHFATAGLEEEWNHGLPDMLVGRVPNKLRGRVQIGVSDFAGIRDYLLDLNETASVGSVNMRLTGRKRAVITASAAENNDRAAGDGAPTPEDPGSTRRRRVIFDPAEDVFVEDPLDTELGKSSGDPFRVIEYNFDADGVIAWKQEIVDSAITRAGLVAQYVGTNDKSGYAISGTAIRLRLIPTDKTGRSKGRHWDSRYPRILRNMQLLDALPVADGGFGNTWTNPEIAPTVERHPGIPVDELEDAQRHGILISNGLESRQTAVEEMHRGWDETRVKAEVERIEAEQARATPGGAGSLFGV